MAYQRTTDPLTTRTRTTWTLTHIYVFDLSVHNVQVSQFIETLDAFDGLWQKFDGELRSIAETVQSPTLKALLTPGQRFPDLEAPLA